MTSDACDKAVGSATGDVRRRYLAGLIVLVAAAALIRVAVLHARPVWDDERHTIALAGMTPAEIVRSLSTDVHPPLYFHVVRWWGRAFGVSAESLRGFSAVCGMAILPALLFAGRSLVGREAALAACLLTSFSPIHIHYSAEARSYAFVELLVLFSTLATVRLSREPNWQWAVAYVATMSAALYTHYWCAFVVITDNVYWILFVRPLADRRWRFWIGAQVAVAMTLLPWIVVMPGQLSAGHGDWIDPPPLDAPLKTLFRFTTGWDFLLRTNIVRAIEAVLFVPYLVVLAAGAKRSPDGDRARATEGADLAFFCAAPILAGYVFSLLGKPMYVIGRFDVIVFPIFALLFGRGFMQIGRGAQRIALSAVGISCVLYLSFVLRP